MLHAQAKAPVGSDEPSKPLADAERKWLEARGAVSPGQYPAESRQNWRRMVVVGVIGLLVAVGLSVAVGSRRGNEKESATILPKEGPSMSSTYIGKKRNAGAVIVFGIITLGIYTLVWYYKINNEIKKHDSTQDVSPGLATFALFIPIANLVSFYNTANRIKLMQKADKSTDLISPGAALLWAILFYIGYPIYVQGTLNNHWHEHAVSSREMEVAEQPKSTEPLKGASANNYCGKCGTSISGDESFCPQCGNKI